MKWTILIFVLFLPTTSFAQGFSKLLDFDHPGASFSDMVLHGDTISIYGFVIGKSAPYLQGISLARLDTHGIILDYKTYFDSIGDDYGFYFPTDFSKLDKDAGYAMLGTLFSRRNGFLIKADAKGNQTFAKEYPDSTSATDYYRKIVELNDGFLIGGDKQLAAKLNDHQVFVMRTDKQGNKIWEKRFGLESRVDVLSSLVKINNNEFVVGCTTVNFSAPTSDWSPTTKIFAVDSLGNVKWEWESPLSLKSEGAVGLQKNSNGEWTYANIRLVFGLGEWHSQAMLTRRDSHFNLVWEKDFGQPTSPFNVFHDLKPAPEGGYIGVGSYQESLLINPDAYPTGWMCRWSEAGDSLWSRKDKGVDIAGLNSESYLGAVAPLPSGSFIACGYSNGAGNSWAWLIKVNRDGCIDTLLCMASGLEPEPEISRIGVRVYPNPASDRVSFLLHLFPAPSNVSLRIIDLNGKTVLFEPSLPSTGEFVWLTQNVPSGLYFYHLSADGVFSQSGSIVVHR